MVNKEITAHIRSRIAHAGIKARVHMVAGNAAVVVSAPTYEARFTADEIREFCTIAKINRMTFVRDIPIDPEHEARLTEKITWHFYA